MKRPTAKLLKNLLRKIPVITTGEIPEVKIRAINNDSRKIQPGDAFFAIKGEDFNGFDFIPQATAAGASLIIGKGNPPKNLSLPYLELR